MVICVVYCQKLAQGNITNYKPIYSVVLAASVDLIDGKRRDQEATGLQ